MGAGSPLSRKPKRNSRHRRCRVQALRDLLQPEIAAKVAPFGPLLKPASDALEFGCLLEPGEGRQEVKFTCQEVERVKESAELIEALLRVAAASPRYAPIELMRTFVCRDLMNRPPKGIVGRDGFQVLAPSSARHHQLLRKRTPTTNNGPAIAAYARQSNSPQNKTR